MKQILMTLLALLLPVTAMAIPPDNYEFELDGIYYKVVNGEAWVTFQSYSNGSHISDYHGDVIIPATVAYQGTTYVVSAIDDFAFNCCVGLTSVTIPNSVTSIGSLAFSGCSNLTSVTIGRGVETIGKDAFLDAPAIETITCRAMIPPTWEDMSMFSTNVYNDAKVHVPGGQKPAYVSAPYWGQFQNNIIDDIGEVPAYDFEVDGIYYKIVGNEASVIFKYYTHSLHYSGYASVYTGDVTIPATVAYQNTTYPVTSVYEYAFLGCRGLTSVTFPNTITSIGHHAFDDCTGLTSIEIPSSVTTIDYCAFELCSELTEVNITDIEAWCNIYFGDYYANPLCFARHLYLNGYEVTDLAIPESVTRIGQYAFMRCTGLTNLDVPDSVTSIGSHAFLDCTSLARVHIGNSVTSIDEEAFSGCTALTNLTLGNALTTIGNAAFKHCSSLTHIRIPDSVISLGHSAFTDCSSLKYALIGNSVTYIGPYAFNYCTSLTRVTIGKSVRIIGKDAFQNDPEIETITCKALTPPWWEDMSMFTTDVYNQAQLHVMDVSEVFFQADHYWGQFQNIIGDASDNDPIGDVNGDGEVTLADANSVIEIVIMGGNAGHNHTPGDGLLYGDINGDCEVNIADVNAIIDIILSKK